jgi:regulatory associated protein of mTOR
VSLFSICLTLSCTLLVADAIVRLYRNYDPMSDHGPVQMVSAFRGLNELVQVKQGSGLILDWKQSGGSLLVGGDSRIIRVWDAHAETQTLVVTIPDLQFLS